MIPYFFVGDESGDFVEDGNGVVAAAVAVDGGGVGVAGGVGDAGGSLPDVWVRIAYDVVSSESNRTPNSCVVVNLRGTDANDFVDGVGGQFKTTKTMMTRVAKTFWDTVGTFCTEAEKAQNPNSEIVLSYFSAEDDFEIFQQTPGVQLDIDEAVDTLYQFVDDVLDAYDLEEKSKEEEKEVDGDALDSFFCAVREWMQKRFQSDKDKIAPPAAISIRFRSLSGW